MQAEIQRATGKPFALAADEGERIEWPGVDIVLKASGDATGGAFTLMEDTSDAMTVPWHVHEDDEAFYVLEGEYLIRCGDEEFTVGPGGFVFLPAGIPHEQTTSARARKLILAVPGGLEGFFRGMAEGFKEGMTPEKRDAIAARNRLRFL
jgi:mannose-6-phosphate isomerase-like protein (cupin superfamily)